MYGGRDLVEKLISLILYDQYKSYVTGVNLTTGIDSWNMEAYA